MDAIIRGGLCRFTDMIGQLWCSLADYYIRSGHFDRVSLVVVTDRVSLAVVTDRVSLVVVTDRVSLASSSYRQGESSSSDRLALR